MIVFIIAAIALIGVGIAAAIKAESKKVPSNWPEGPPRGRPVPLSHATAVALKDFENKNTINVTVLEASKESDGAYYTYYYKLGVTSSDFTFYVQGPDQIGDEGTAFNMQLSLVPHDGWPVNLQERYAYRRR